MWPLTKVKKRMKKNFEKKYNECTDDDMHSNNIVAMKMKVVAYRSKMPSRFHTLCFRSAFTTQGHVFSIRICAINRVIFV